MRDSITNIRTWAQVSKYGKILGDIKRMKNTPWRKSLTNNFSFQNYEEEKEVTIIWIKKAFLDTINTIRQPIGNKKAKTKPMHWKLHIERPKGTRKST
jgi:hypothetical protein